MQPNLLLGGLFVGLSLISNGQARVDAKPKSPVAAPESLLTDGEGNTYKVKKIGSRYWMTSNFKATQTPGGSPIQGVYAYNDDKEKARSHGRLYTWPAAVQATPMGWHLPTQEDWEDLLQTQGGQAIAGGPLKETGTAHWNPPNTGASNSSGFAAIGGGFRGGDGLFYDLGNHGAYWGTAQGGKEPYCVYIYSTHCNVVTEASPSDKTSGLAFAVRYVKD